MILKKIGDYLGEASWELDRGNKFEARSFEQGAMEFLRELEQDLESARKLILKYNEENGRNI